MEAFTGSTPSPAARPANVDTDEIIPKQFLKSIERSGLRREPVRRVALNETAARGRVRAEPARVQGRADPGRAQFRLRLVARARRWALDDYGSAR